MTSRIGGLLNLEALAAIAGRNRHEPRTRDTMRAAVHEMAARGMTHDTIAAATGLSVEIIRDLLEEAQ